MSEETSKTPQRQELVQAVGALQKAAKAQEVAQSLREQASSITDPKKREKLIRDAYEKEIEAHGQSKLARRLQSGPWQGLAAGGGIGAGVGVGLGTVVGVVTGAVVSVPTTALGALIGSGVGAVHGPWIKLGGKDKKLADVPTEEIVDAIEEQGKGDAQDIAAPAAQLVESESTTVKRQPRKLEIRSSRGSEAKTEAELRELDNASRKPKPRKIEVRSASQHEPR